MRSRLRVERIEKRQDKLGQPVEEWVCLFTVKARRMRDNGSDNDPSKSGREREHHRAVYRIRSVKEKYVQRGDRIVSLADRGHGESVWDVTAIEPMMDPLWVDVLCERTI